MGENKIKYGFIDQNQLSDFEIWRAIIRAEAALIRWRNKLNEIQEDIKRIKNEK